MSSQDGSAQVIMDEDVYLRVKVKNADGHVVTEYFREIDTQYIGAQIIFDILNDDRHKIPEEMRTRPGQCPLFLTVEDRRVQVDNYRRLSWYSEYLRGAPATLHLLQPEANISKGMEMYPVNELDSVRINNDA